MLSNILVWIFYIIILNWRILFLWQFYGKKLYVVSANFIVLQRNIKFREQKSTLLYGLALYVDKFFMIECHLFLFKLCTYVNKYCYILAPVILFLTCSVSPTALRSKADCSRHKGLLLGSVSQWTFVLEASALVILCVLFCIAMIFPLYYK